MICKANSRWKPVIKDRADIHRIICNRILSFTGLFNNHQGNQVNSVDIPSLYIIKARMKRIKTGDSMNSFHWLAALAILGLLTAGCSGTSGKNSGALTKSADANEALSMYDGVPRKVSTGLDINGSFCGAGTCRQQLISADGDAITVTLPNIPQFQMHKMLSIQ